MDLRRVLIFPDAHSLEVDKKAWGCFLDYAWRAGPWDEVVGLGDLLDGNAISAHNKGKPKLVEGERLFADYETANALLDELEECTPGARITLLKGNHEYRVDRYIQEHPELEGLIEVEQGLKLKERDIKLIDCYPGGKVHKLGKLHFTHGIFTGKNACRKHLDVFGCNIVFGHTHQVGIETATKWGKSKSIAAYNLGCLCKYDARYLEGNPTNWQHAFGTAYIRKNGLFNLTIHNIFNGECVVDGKTYSWRNN